MDTSILPDCVVSTLCRLCAEKNLNLNPIFGSKLLPLKINKCLPITVSPDDILPVTICEECEKKVSQHYAFYESCLNADQRLQWLWNVFLRKPFSDSDKDLITPNNVITDCLDKNSKVLAISEIQPLVLAKSDGNIDVNTGKIIASFPDKCPADVPRIENLMKANQVSLGAGGDECIQTLKEALPSIDKSDKANLRKHLSKPRKYQCKFCSKQLSSTASLSVHESTHSQDNPYLCDSCGKSFKHAYNLRSHARTHLSTRKRFFCKICNKSFLTNFFLKEHVNIHTGETPYKCQECKKEFRERIHLRQHMWTHSSDKFVCEICGTPFSRKGNMKEHIKRHHNNSKKATKILKHQGNETTKQNQFQCGICNELYLNESCLKIHLKTHSNQQAYFCSMCGKKFRHSGSLTYHKRAAHTGEKPFQCSYCSEKFSLRSVQKIHERKNHTFERPFKCNMCSKSFTNSSSLKNHSYIHMKSKIFDCNECGKKFARKSNLAIHLKLHSNDRQFTCDQCGKSYIQKHDLIKHKRNHDPKRKPFYCKFCGNNFSHKKNIIKHAACQFDYSKRKNMEKCQAEKILDSVSNSFRKSSESYLETQHLISETVKKFTTNSGE